VRGDLRRLDRDTAMRILLALTRYGEVGDGDVKRLTDREGLYRLRVGKWRVFFDLDAPSQARNSRHRQSGTSVLTSRLLLTPPKK
jgi:mRNA interferase RelE/StbE